jgi:methenyltetrahydrofolate cyclohydrolase
MKLIDQPVSALLAAIRDPGPTPGGGAAAALAAAVGASLLAMVAAMPKHRAASEEDVERLRAAGRRCQDLSERLESLVDEDSAAYDAVIAAYRLPRTSEEERTERHRRIQAALRAATEAPLEVMGRCRDGLEAASTVARFGNPNASSDVGVALELLLAAGRGARLNVEINLASLDDGDYVARVGETVGVLETEGATGAAAARSLLSSSRS